MNNTKLFAVADGGFCCIGRAELDVLLEVTDELLKLCGEALYETGNVFDYLFNSFETGHFHYVAPPFTSKYKFFCSAISQRRDREGLCFRLLLQHHRCRT